MNGENLMMREKMKEVKITEILIQVGKIMVPF